METIVMKFGGASVPSLDKFSYIADVVIDRKKKSNAYIIVVISAMKGVTNELEEMALKVNPNPPRRELDMLVSVGERVSTALLTMSLHERGYDCVSLTGSQAGIITTAEHSDAKIVHVKPERVVNRLKKDGIVVVAGFQGVSLDREITTLGRGGSDITAVALGIALGSSRVEFYKDVKGVYENDPKEFPDAVFVPLLTYDEALDIIERNKTKVLHPRSVKLAKQNSLNLWITSFADALDSYDLGSSIQDRNVNIGSSPSYEVSDASTH